MNHRIASAFLLVLAIATVASAQEEIRRKKKGWSDLGLRLEDKKPIAGWTANVADVVEGSAAAKAGIVAGDRITWFEGKDDPSSEQVMAALWANDPDHKVKLKLSHAGATKEFEILPDVIPGQDQPGMNNTMHHPPAIRGVVIEAEKPGEDAKLPAVYAFDITISFEWTLSDDELAQAKKMAEEAGRIWYDALEGQMIWRKVEIRSNKEGWETAQYRCRKAKRGGFLGVEHVTPGGQCMLNFSVLDSTAAWVWVHEAGHMQLGSGDEYPYGKGEKTCGCLMGGGNRVELCVEKNHDFAMKESCWDNAKRWYPNLARVTETAKGPALKRTPEIVVIAPKPAAPGETPKPAEPVKGRGFLGIGVAEMDDDDKKALKDNGYEGAVKVQVMDDSAAEKGGMQGDDLLVEFEGKKVSSVQELAPLVQKCGAGKVVKIVILRSGKKKELAITLGVHPEDRDQEDD